MINHIAIIISFIGVIIAQDLQDLSNDRIPQLVEDIGSAIVLIVADGDNYRDKRQGSGVVVSNGDYVITNAHVIAGARKVVIKFLDGKQQTVYGYSAEDQRRDLVSIKIKNSTGINWVNMRKSTNVKIGESVVAIGNPQGLSHSVSEGIISGKREFEKGVLVLQTTAPVSPGSSGGGLFDMDGKLIGITSFLHKGGQNLNFAYPTEFITSLLNHYDYKSFRNLNLNVTPQATKDDATVYVTKTGKKFHKYGCSYLRKGSKTIKLSVASYKYSPCSRCFK